MPLVFRLKVDLKSLDLKSYDSYWSVFSSKVHLGLLKVKRGHDTFLLWKFFLE